MPANVQSAPLGHGFSTPTTVSATFGSPLTAGNAVGVVVWTTSATHVATSVTDDKGNTYHLAIELPTGNTSAPGLAIYLAYGIVGGGTAITANVNANVDSFYADIMACEYSGVQSSSSPLNATGHASNYFGPSSHPATSLVGTNASDLIIAGGCNPFGTTLTSDNLTMRVTDLSGGVGYICGMADGTLAVTPSFSPANVMWNCAAASFLAASGGAPNDAVFFSNNC